LPSDWYAIVRTVPSAPPCSPNAISTNPGSARGAVIVKAAGALVMEPRALETTTRYSPESCATRRKDAFVSPGSGKLSRHHWYSGTGTQVCSTVNITVAPWVTVCEAGGRVIVGVAGGSLLSRTIPRRR